MGSKARKREQGVTLILMAVALAALVAMAALAIDVIALYVAHADAQRAANAAALAGAKGFVTSGFTSGLMGDPTNGTVQSSVCTSNVNDGTIVNLQANTVAGQNQVAGQPATLQSIVCNFGNAQNPQVTVTVQRTGVPTFFAKIWGSPSNTVSATATAEAYNPSALTVPIQASVKPFLIPNCDPHAGKNCNSSPNYFFDTTNNDSPNNPSTYLGQQISIAERRPGAAAPVRGYYIINLTSVNQCPASSSSCTGTGQVYDAIACGSSTPLSCGQNVSVFTGTSNGQTRADIVTGTQCLIHSTGAAPGTGQDLFPGPAPSTSITGGTDNPNPNFQSVVNISRSDSVVTVPVYAGTTDPCTPGPSPGSCPTSVPIIGFLQLGIQDVQSSVSPFNSTLDAIVLNAAGCNPSATSTPISGGGISPIPVRLINTIP